MRELVIRWGPGAGWTALFLGMLTLSTPHAAMGQSTGPGASADAFELVRSGTATRVDVGPAIDGTMSDPIWQRAEPLADFVQHEPVVGSPISEHTEVRILFDDDALYIGARLLDEEADRIIVGERRRNANLSQSDAFIVVLDTYADGQNGFVFGTNPGGIEYDGQVRGGGGVNTSWDGSWTVATSRDEHGWYAEFRIPFSTLRYGSADVQSWGLNMARYIGRKNEQAFWSPVQRQYNLYRLTEAGTLNRIEPPARRVTTVTPYLLSGVQRGLPSQEVGATDFPFEFGADAKIGITPSLALDLTVNTDFAQVEVDDQQVDLTRFSLFFPERRPFFLENADLFSMVSNRPGSTSTPVRMFHSRRIGVHGGQEVPIQAGARLSGRVGGTDVGVLHMRTEGLDGVQDPTGWTVGRVIQELPNRSRVGGIVSQRRSSDLSSDYNRVYGVDARLGIRDQWTFDALAGVSETPGLDGDERVLALVGEYQSRDWQISAFYDHVGDAFSPEIGFVRRTGFQEWSTRAQRNVRPAGVEWLRELRPHASYTVSHNLDGFKETERVHLHTHIEFEAGHLIMPAFDRELDGLTRPFRIAGTDIEVPPGSYRGWTFWSMQRTNSAAPISFNNRIEIGSFLSGERIGVSGGVSVRRGGTLTGSLNVNHNRLDLPEGSFNTTLTRLRVRYAFTPALSLQSSVQYSDQTGVWTGHMRFGWLDTAGTGLFVVYNERHTLELDGIAGILPRDGLGRPERTLAVKFTRQFDVTRPGW